MADTIRRRCPSCNGAFLLNGGVARCPHCGQVVSAGGIRRSQALRSTPRLGSSKKMVSRGFSIGSIGGSTQRETSHHVSGSQIAPEVVEFRAAANRQLTANRQYWAAEAQAIEAEFGMIPAWLGELLR